jgi:hypothetical protein
MNIWKTLHASENIVDEGEGHAAEPNEHNEHNKHNKHNEQHRAHRATFQKSKSTIQKKTGLC